MNRSVASLAFCLAVCAGPAAGAAFAGDLIVTVTTPDGKPLPDAVVTLPAKLGAPKPAFAWKQQVAQQDRQFVPFVLIAPVGGEVEFPNLDKFRHHVYSFSKGNKFELELFGREEKRMVTFKTAGTAAIGCNIHDEMVAFIRVVATPHAGKTSGTGVAEIASAPDGAAVVSVWHPHARSRDQTVTQSVVVASASPTHVSIVVDVAPPKHH